MRNKFKRSLFTGFLALILSIGINIPLPAQLSGSATDLIQQSKEYYDLGQFSSAVTTLKQAGQIYQAADDRIQEARTLSLLSLVYEELGRDELAQEAIDSSLTLIEQVPKTNSSDRIQAQILNRLGRWQLAKGEGKKSLETFKQAEFFYTQSADLQGQRISQLNQAQAFQSLGFSSRATKILDGLVEQLDEQSPPEIQLSILNSLGNAYRRQGNLNRGSKLLTESLALAQSLNLDSETSKILLTLGNIKLTQASQAENLNKPQLLVDSENQALNYYQKAAATAIFPLDKVQAQLNQLSLLIQINRQTAATNLLLPIVNNLEQLPTSRASIYARINFADSLLKIPAQNRAKLEIRSILHRAIADARNLADIRGESAALGAMGKFYEAKSKTRIAKRYTLSAIAITQDIDAPDLDYQWQWQLGRLLTQENKYPQAIDAYAQSIKDLQSLRFDIASTNPELQFSFRDSVEPVYRQYISLLLRLPQPSQANLQKSIAVIEELKVAELDNLFRNACVEAESVDINQFDQNTAVIYPLVLPERLELILKLPQQDKLYYYSQPGISELEIDQAVEQLQRSLTKRSISPSQLQQEEAQFYNWLIEPFAPQLESTLAREASQIKNLVFVLDGALRNLPMSALYDGQNYLITRYGVAISPGVKLVIPKNLERDQLKVLLAGSVNTPSFEAQELAPLNNVAIELAGIAETIKNTKTLEGSDFLQANIQEQINNDSFNIVHIATHGKFSSNSQETYILDWSESIGLADLDRLLQAENFERAKVIDLLVLSACETATGDRQAALGLAGVAVRSGASSTLASLWQVNDASTAEFMIEFYRQLNNLQLSKAEALRNTQLNFLAKSDSESDYNRPYHWASFILVGDWR